MIPKIIHHIWLEEKPESDPAKTFRESWYANHPSWEHQFWTPEKVESELIDTGRLTNLTEYYNYSTERMYEYARQLVAYEILNTYGGVVVSPDVECFKPIDDLIEGVEMFAHYGPHDPLAIEESVMGSLPQSIQIQRVIWRLPFYYLNFGINDYYNVCGAGMLTETWSGISTIKIFTKELLCPHTLGVHPDVSQLPGSYAAKRWGEHTTKADAECHSQC